MYQIVSPTGTVHEPPRGGCWKVVESKYRELLEDNRIYFPRSGAGRPRRKTFFSELEGLVPETLWLAKDVDTNDTAKRESLALFPEDDAFTTPKPERLLQRIIHIASNPGDVVLDCFVGSGTTAAVSHKMGRRWLGVEWSADTIERYAIPRLTKVVFGTDLQGITKTVAWEGGGGFRVLGMAPSMFEADDHGLVFLPDHMTNGVLAEATAAQLGFGYEVDPPFAGRKGRTRLAVVDGVVSESVVRLFVDALGERERVTICGTGLDPAARPLLRELRPGSTLRKIPAALLDEYVYRRRDRQRDNDKAENG